LVSCLLINSPHLKINNNTGWFKVSTCPLGPMGKSILENYQQRTKKQHKRAVGNEKGGHLNRFSGDEDNKAL